MNVLVVWQEGPGCDAVTAALERAGMRVRCVHSPSRAVADFDPAAVGCVVVGPGEHEAPVVAALREISEEVFIVVCVPAARPDLAAEGIEGGADAAFPLSFYPETLVALVRRALDRAAAGSPSPSPGPSPSASSAAPGENSTLDVLLAGVDQGLVEDLASRYPNLGVRPDLLSAIVQLRTRPARVLVVSYPDLAGREEDSLRALREIAPNLQILVLYPPSQAESYQEAARLGADDTVLEPAYPREVEVRVGKLLEKARFREDSLQDQLTGAGNRMRFERSLESEILRATRHARPLSLVLADVNAFKDINDHLGHLAGDEALRLTAEVLRRVFRQSDVVCRFGGDEFVVIMPETDAEAAERAVKRFQEAYAGVHLEGEEELPTRALSASVGLATWAPGDGDADEVRADPAAFVARIRKQLLEDATVPLHAAKDVFRAGRRLGARLGPGPRGGGFPVEGVYPGGAAEKAELAAGDRILAADGRTAGEFGDLIGFARFLLEAPTGLLLLEVRRGRGRKTLPVDLPPPPTR